MNRYIWILLFVCCPVFGQTGYEPFLIAPFSTGKSIGMEPWQSPIDAFPTLQNARVNKGVLEKRQGYQLFATMNHGGVDQTDTFIMGIHLYLNNGLPQLLVFDTLRVNRYHVSDQTMTDITGDSDIFSGNNDDFFSFVNWLGKGYMVNNVDQIYQYDGENDVSVFDIQVDDNEDDNHVNTCRYIFIKNDRMILLDVVEHGNWLPQRLRYSPVLSTNFNQSGAGFVDAPTQERIVSAGWVGKDIAVFFQGLYSGSLWKIKTTGDSDLPFRWEKITTTDTSLAPYSTVEFNDGITVIGLNNILWYDGFKIQYIDLQKVRDIVDDFDSSKIRFSIGHNVIEDQHIFYTYTSQGGSTPDRVLDYNIIEQSWSVYTVPAHVFGTFTNQAVPIWTETDDVFAFDGALMSDMTLDSREILGDPFPFTLMGSTDSNIYTFDVGDYDRVDSAAGTIAMSILSARWNPYLKENKEVLFGRIAFLVDNDSSASALVSFYKNTRSNAWITKTLTCYDATDTLADKIWVTLHLNGERGNFHRIKISHDERNNRPRIHAIMLLMQPGGTLNL